MTTIWAPPDDALARLIAAASDPVVFTDGYGFVRHPAAGTIPFRLWPWQRALLRRFTTQPLTIILKARQLGVSELAVAYAMWLARFQPSKTILMLSKTQDSAEDLMQRAAFLHDHLPAWMQAGERALDGCEPGKVNQSTLEFVHRFADGTTHPSRIESLPATGTTGRGKTASLVILDEWAHQQFDRDIWAAIEPTIDAGGTLIGISTANGQGNVFQRTWAGAVARDNSFTPIFLAWHRHPDRDATWYAAKARNVEPWQLHQEYPAHPEEAFVQSGRPVFDRVYLDPIGAAIAADPAPCEDADGLTVWEPPRDDATYLIAADVAEGLAHGDFNAAVVLDTATWAEVAELHGRWPPDVFAALLNALGWRYHAALLAVERNNHGHACLLELRHRGYPTLYHHHDALRTDAEDDDRPGFPTTTVTKPLMIDALAEALRTGAYRPRSLPALVELRTFSYHANGSMSAPDGAHDDRVICRAIAAYLVKQGAGLASGAPLDIMHFRRGR